MAHVEQEERERERERDQHKEGVCATGGRKAAMGNQFLVPLTGSGKSVSSTSTYIASSRLGHRLGAITCFVQVKALLKPVIRYF